MNIGKLKALILAFLATASWASFYIADGLGSPII
jgi:hypothetical protein